MYNFAVTYWDGVPDEKKKPQRVYQATLTEIMNLRTEVFPSHWAQLGNAVYISDGYKSSAFVVSCGSSCESGHLCKDTVNNLGGYGEDGPYESPIEPYTALNCGHRVSFTLKTQTPEK